MAEHDEANALAIVNHKADTFCHITLWSENGA